MQISSMKISSGSTFQKLFVVYILLRKLINFKLIPLNNIANFYKNHYLDQAIKIIITKKIDFQDIYYQKHVSDLKTTSLATD